MKVVGDQHPGIAVGTGFRQQLSQALHKVVTIIIIPEDPAPFNPKNNDMVEQTGAVDTRLSRKLSDYAGRSENLEV